MSKKSKAYQAAAEKVDRREPDLAAQGITLPATALPSTSPAYAAAILDDLIATYRARIDWDAYRTPVVDDAGRRPTHRI